MIVRDGIPFVAAGILVTALAGWLGHLLLIIPGLLLTTFLAYFFRNPERHPPQGGAIISPADGKVIVVRELGPGQNNSFHWFISIFMSPLDVHVNRSPVEGEIVEYEYLRGGFKPAFNENASLENERNRIVIQGSRLRVQVSQVAGILARRIVFWKKVGDHLRRGERMGLIRFGSRVDVWFTAAARPAVETGKRVAAGQTILAEWVTP